MSLTNQPFTMASDSVVENFDVDSLKISHESDTEWRLRRSFLVAHKDKFPQSRLICLSCCFINTEVYGNRYPASVMALLKDLATELPQDCREFRQTREEEKKIKFVRSEEQMSEMAITSECVETKAKRSSDQDRMNRVMSFVKANSDYKSTDVAFQKPELRVFKPMSFDDQPQPDISLSQFSQKGGFKKGLDDFQTSMKKFEVKRGYDARFGKLTKHLRAMQSDDKNSISKLHLAADKVRVKLTCTISDAASLVKKGIGYFVSDLFLDSVLTASGEGLNKKASKHDAYTKAIEKLRMPYLRVLELETGELELESSDTPFEGPKRRGRNEKIAFVKSESEGLESNEAALSSSRKRSRSQLERGLAEFIIMEPYEPQQGMIAATILRQSADFSKMLLEFEFRDVGSGVRCRVFLEGQFLEESFAPTKHSSKISACEKALEKLRGLCWTILTKQRVDGDESNVTREELMGDIKKLNEQISSDNIGSKLLQKMGWTGGGVGKEGNKGIAEPVSVNSVINREGLGLMSERGIEVEFLPKVKSVLMDYARSPSQNDLAFSPQFNKEERAIIHNECRKLGLKSGSKGSGDERFLIVSRKRTACQLLSHVLHSGGSTHKYELLPPGSVRESAPGTSGE